MSIAPKDWVPGMTIICDGRDPEPVVITRRMDGDFGPGWEIKDNPFSYTNDDWTEKFNRRPATYHDLEREPDGLLMSRATNRICEIRGGKFRTTDSAFQPLLCRNDWLNSYPLDADVYRASLAPEIGEPDPMFADLEDSGQRRALSGQTAGHTIHRFHRDGTTTSEPVIKPTHQNCADGRDAGKPCLRATDISHGLIEHSADAMNGLELIGTGQDECLGRVRYHIAEITRLIRQGGHSACGDCPNCLSKSDGEERGKAWVKAHKDIRIIPRGPQPPEELKPEDMRGLEWRAR